MTAPSHDIAECSSLAPLAATADAWFVNIWGVLHNGVRPYPDAVEACRRFREGGGTVILVSNSPRLRPGVIRQLDDIGVAADAYDDVVTSGDVTRRLIEPWRGRAVRHIGPERDALIFDGFGVRRAAADEADIAVCSGLFDDEAETPKDYERELATLRARELTMICANPDLKVERGGRVIYCAGAIAAAYEAIGGSVLTAGKPHAPIYEAAMAAVAAARGCAVEKSRVLAIGDGVATDIAGAAAFGLRSVFVASRIDMNSGEDLRQAARRLFGDWKTPPVCVMPALAW